MLLTLQSLHPLFAAEASGIDLTQRLDLRRTTCDMPCA
jgi:hypothetical protein